MEMQGAGFTQMAGEATLQIDPGNESDMLAIMWSYLEGFGVAWFFEVYAHTDQGKYRVDTFLVQPPQIQPPGARLIATAYYPGVTMWSVVGRGFEGAAGSHERIDLILTTGRQGRDWKMRERMVGMNAGEVRTHKDKECDCHSCCGSSASQGDTGVTPIQQGGFAENAFTAWERFAPAQINQVIANPFTALTFNDPTFTVAELFGTVDVAVPPFPAGGLWVQVFDQVAAPVAGDVPFARFYVTSANRTWDFQWSGPGMKIITNTLWVAVSDAFAIFSPAANASTDVNAKFRA